MHYADKQIPLPKRGRNWTRKGGRSWKRFDSVTALKRLIETLGPAQSSKFFNYDGQEYSW
jgi:hypothetical protein